jgi:hypothetical protein
MLILQNLYSVLRMDADALTCKIHMRLSFELWSFFQYMHHIIQNRVYNDMVRYLF